MQGWRRQLAVHQVSPRIPQLDLGRFVLAGDRADATSIDDFQGHALAAFALRKRAHQRGYVLAAEGEPGYQTRFPELGLVAVIGFGDHTLPEEDRLVALTTLSFARLAGTDTPHGRVMLRQVPAILLSQCYGDWARLAADGPGFTADWQQKTRY